MILIRILGVILILLGIGELFFSPGMYQLIYTYRSLLVDKESGILFFLFLIFCIPLIQIIIGVYSLRIKRLSSLMKNIIYGSFLIVLIVVGYIVFKISTNILGIGILNPGI